jgi:hypothetical protein
MKNVYMVPIVIFLGVSVWAAAHKAMEETKGKTFSMKDALSQTERWMCYWMLHRSDMPYEMFIAFEEHIEGLPE